MVDDEVQILFASLQQQLAADLLVDRLVLRHPSAKGEASETGWVQMLERHLPYRYRVGKAFVLDSTGKLSDQIDVVIYDRQYTPVLFNHHGQLYVPAESVYAVFEVKQTLDKANVEYAGEKAVSVRRLYRTTTEIHHAGGTFEPREPLRIIAGMLCYGSGWNPPFGEPFSEVVGGLEELNQLDLGCVAESGSFTVNYPEAGTPDISTSDDRGTLIYFFFQLLGLLQALGTVPAIDYSAYARIQSEKMSN